jgi:putative flippase GtrA
MQNDEKKLFGMIVKTFASLIAACLTWVVTYLLACLIAPPYSIDGHPVMPTVQVFLAFAIAIASGVYILYLLLKRFVRIG